MIDDLSQKLRVKLSGLLDLFIRLFIDQTVCADGHDVLVIRRKGYSWGGLVVVHIGALFNQAETEMLMGYLTTELLNALVEQNIFEDRLWSYMELRLRGTQVIVQIRRAGNKNLYWDPFKKALVELA